MMLVVAAALFSLQSAGALPAAPSDSQQRSSDQQPQPSKVQQLALTDSAKAGTAAAAKVAASSNGKVAIVKDTGSGSEALTFTSAQVRHLWVQAAAKDPRQYMHQHTLLICTCLPGLPDHHSEYCRC
jgi:hypothetical protein